MKLVHIDLNQNLLENNFITEWIIESPEAFSEYVREIYLQCEGKDGRFVLSQNGKELDMSKYAEIIFNVYELDVNNRKILNKVYQGLEDLAYIYRRFFCSDSGNESIFARVYFEIRGKNRLYIAFRTADRLKFFV